MNTTRTYVGARMLVAAVVMAALSVPIPAVPAAGETLTQHTWAWGANSSGQLGDGRTNNRSYAGAVPGMADVVHAAAGVSHSLALDSSGTVWAWGSNAKGELGDGTTDSRPSPASVTGLTGVVTVAAGRQHSLALLADGTVRAWGSNADAQLGDGTTVDRHEPVRVAGLDHVVAIATSDWQSFAVRADGTVWAWGGTIWTMPDEGGPGQYVPSPVPLLGDVTDISVSGTHMLALRRDGTVLAWGYNSDGQLGDGTTISRGTPMPADIADVVAIAAGERHSLALRNDGTVWAWGRNTHGQAGGAIGENRLLPARVQGLDDISAIAAGADHSLAVSRVGRMWAWGRNTDGQLGDGTTADRATPSAVAGIEQVQAVAAGAGHTLAVRTSAPAEPGVPTRVSPTAGDGSASVTWRAPPAGGTPLTGYSVFMAPDGVTKTVGPDSTSVEFTGLTNGTRYRFTVQAANALGTSRWSPISEPVVYATVPGAPTNVTAVVPCVVCAPAWHPNGPSIVVTWNAAPDRGSAITGYRITRQPGGVTTSVGDVRSWTATGLEYGVGYTFTVTAVNAVGEGPASSPSPAVTARAAPAPPSTVRATSGDAQAHVTWDAPPDGGSPIVNYEVFVTPGWQTITVDGDDTSTTIGGLTNGTAYAFTVRATNRLGASPESRLSNWVTPASPVTPGAVANLTRTVGFDRLTAATPRPRVALTWTNLGAPDAIKVQWTEGSRTRSVTLPSDSTRHTVTDLAYGRRYWFTVRAINSGTPSAPSTVSAHGSAVDAIAKTSAGATVVKGELTRAGTGTPLGGRWVQLQTRSRKADGSYSRWSNPTSAVRTTSTGTYRVRHRIPAGKQYRVVFAGAGRDLGTVSRVSTMR